MMRRLFAAGLVAAALGFTALGVWQLERRAWKLALIERVNTRIHAPPRSLWDIGPLDGDVAYRRITATGVWLEDRPAYVQALTERGAGYWLLTPLRTDRGVVLVNRGFVPPDRKRQGVCQSGSNKRVTITGLVRASEPHGGFLRTNDARADRWYSRDVQAIGRSRSLQHLAPVFIDADAAPTRDGYPVGGLTVVTFRNAHLAYALTWFALAAMSAAGAVVLLKSKGR